VSGGSLAGILYIRAKKHSRITKHRWRQTDTWQHRAHLIVELCVSQHRQYKEPDIGAYLLCRWHRDTEWKDGSVSTPSLTLCQALRKGIQVWRSVASGVCASVHVLSQTLWDVSEKGLTTPPWKESWTLAAGLCSFFSIGVFLSLIVIQFFQQCSTNEWPHASNQSKLNNNKEYTHTLQIKQRGMDFNMCVPLWGVEQSWKNPFCKSSMWK